MKMNALNKLYTRLLQVGFIVLRQAIASDERAWVQAEVELLHNVPSLIGEANTKRHEYFWFAERAHYLDWISAHGSPEAKSRKQTYYEPVWREMEPLVMELVAAKQQAVKSAIGR
jgi:hypothetical protein